MYRYFTTRSDDQKVEQKTEQMTTSFVPVQITYATRQEKNIRALASKLATGTLKSPDAF
jgi:hypothetical protein